ncbi:EI24 domain-containing protein [uncultured Schumannella sp.]|uniref:EI24 domain-containing protein n=1 Tax=uncultured Schumannella sp. TaxID=1195956 RepID=UPI0025E8B650|nr:EI24 domain-containing protein [uncultured Schumannella sp.]
MSTPVVAAATRPLRLIPEFFRGVALLGRGFAFWSVRPGLMALGLLPAALVGAGLVTAIAVLGAFLDPITNVLTFFAESWDAGWRGALQVVIAIALIIATLALAARVFTALTLLVGAPFYDRIQRAADASRGDVPPDLSPSVWRTIGDTLVLVLLSIGASIVVALVGIIPVIGTVAAAVLGFVATARALSWELTLAPFGTRGLVGREARAALRRRRARSFGFGVAVQVCFLIPFGAIIAMPAAAAGAILLVRDVLDAPAPAGRGGSGG